MITYVLVDSIEDTLKRVRHWEGKILLLRKPTDGGSYAVFSDPEGNILGLWEPKGK